MLSRRSGVMTKQSRRPERGRVAGWPEGVNGRRAEWMSESREAVVRSVRGAKA